MTVAGIAVRALAKAYGPVGALAGIDLEVAPGEIVGLLGPNGAGKTTTIECVAGLVTPDLGSVTVAGIDVADDPAGARRRLGVVLQQTGLPAAITPREAIRAFSVLHDVRPKPHRLLVRFGLAAKADARVETLSGGQRQRLALALAFIGEPPAMLLDEPSTGLDPAMRAELHDHIRALRGEGRAILLATHDMAEAERLCDRAAVLDRGRIVATGTPHGLVAGLARHVLAEVDAAPADGWPDTLPGIGAVAGDETLLRFATDDLAPALSALAAWLMPRGISLLSVRAGAPTLEDLILELGRR